MNTDPNAPAFPVPAIQDDAGNQRSLRGSYGPVYLESKGGLTTRAHFASLFAQAIRSDQAAQTWVYENRIDRAWSREKSVAFAAVTQADALIAELNRA